MTPAGFSGSWKMSALVTARTAIIQPSWRRLSKRRLAFISISTASCWKVSALDSTNSLSLCLALAIRRQRQLFNAISEHLAILFYLTVLGNSDKSDIVINLRGHGWSARLVSSLTWLVRPHRSLMRSLFDGIEAAITANSEPWRVICGRVFLAHNWARSRVADIANLEGRVLLRLQSTSVVIIHWSWVSDIQWRISF